MAPIPIHSTTEEIYRQLLFIDNFMVSAVNTNNLRRSLMGLFLSILIVLIFFFTNSDFGVVGIVMLPILWIGFSIYLLYLKWKTYRRQTVSLKSLAETISTEIEPNSKFFFTDEEIGLVQKDKTTAVKWHEFRAYLEDGDTVYLFQENPYLPWSFSTKEVDATVVTKLKEIAKQKLPVLSTFKHL